MGEWVRYKLDQRTDHILVDEAQDTNAAQWDIVRALTEEFFSGSSESEGRHRTLFMVGDFKQAIYGFQGTDPREFERMRVEVRERAEAASGDDRAPRISRPLDQRQFPFGPGGARRRRWRDPRTSGLKPWACRSARRCISRIIVARPGTVELLKPFAAGGGEDPRRRKDG